ncbi:MAG: hypothetical protein Q7U74_16205 [Saprospiraceae bacterium]|nr:hypothetical protein [Saprospiraceae bacterium]
MKYNTTLFFLLLLCGACDPESVSVEIDIDIRDPVITTLPDSTKQLDFTIVVTQIGNFYHQDFHFRLNPFSSTTIIDSFSTRLPSAREFVTRTVVVPKPGNYWVEARIGTDESGASSGTLIQVPE